MPLSPRAFYEQQYLGHDYASGVESRSEVAELRAFLETYDLQHKRVLELGCGRGAFQRLAQDWFGVDLAASAGRQIKKPFAAASIDALPFKDESFDAAWSITVLEHVPQPEKALLELTRVLRPGGLAYLSPAWHCRPWAADGYQVRSWSELDWKGRLIKASIPVRDALWFRAAYTFPVRMARELLFRLNGRRPVCFRYRELEANYETYWVTDADACSAMDPHEMLLWFRSRGWRTPSHPSWLSRFLVRHGAIVVEKPLVSRTPRTPAPAVLRTAATPQVKRPYRLAVLASHAIQYQGPLFRALAACPEIDLNVLFCSDSGLKPYHDNGFGREVKWDLPLLEGYRSEFLYNWSPSPSTSKFWGVINPAVMSRLSRGRYDALLIHGWSRSTNWLAMLTAFATGTPVLLRGETNLLPTLPPWKAALKRAVLRRLFRRVSGFLAIGRHNADFYKAYGVPEEKIFHVPYAVDNDFFLAQADRLLPKKAELKRALGIEEDRPVILFLGKLTDAKRPMDLLQAFAAVSSNQRAALVYVGDGYLQPALRQYVRERNLAHVYFAGFQNQTELPRFLALADIFVLPSGYEPWGLAVNEAMCFRLPVIVSDQVGAGGDLVQSGVNGFVYPTGQIPALTEKLERLLIGAAEREKMGEASVQRIRQWSYRVDVDAMLACLNEVCHGART